jgi:hypothetical protein
MWAGSGSDLDKKDLCKCDLQFAKLGRQGPLVDQDLCNLHIICVNLHMSPAKTQKCVFVLTRFVTYVFDLFQYLVQFILTLDGRLSTSKKYGNDEVHGLYIPHTHVDYMIFFSQFIDIMFFVH